MPLSDKINLSELNVKQTTGHNCKLAALAGIDNHFAKTFNYAAIPLHKHKVHDKSIRQIAKTKGSVTGELLEIQMQVDVAKELGYEAQIESFNSLDEFENVIKKNLQFKTPMAICFAVELDGPRKGFPTNNFIENEHCAVIKAYDALSQSITMTHWGKEWIVSLSDLYQSNQCLPAERQQEKYVKSETTTYRYKLPGGDRIKYDLVSDNNPAINEVKESIVPKKDSGFKGKLVSVSSINPENKEELGKLLQTRKKGGSFHSCMQTELMKQLRKYAQEVLKRPDIALEFEKSGGVCYGLCMYMAAMANDRKKAESVLSHFLAWDGNPNSLNQENINDFNFAIGTIYTKQKMQAEAHLQGDLLDQNQSAQDLKSLFPKEQLKSQDKKAGNFNIDRLGKVLTEDALRDNFCMISIEEHIMYVTFENDKWVFFDANDCTIDGNVNYRTFPKENQKDFLEKIIINYMRVKNFGNTIYTNLEDVSIPLEIEVTSFINDKAKLNGYGEIENKDLIKAGGLNLICVSDLSTLNLLLNKANNDDEFAKKLLESFQEKVFYYSTINQSRNENAFKSLCNRATKLASSLIEKTLLLAEKHKVDLFSFQGKNWHERDLPRRDFLLSLINANGNISTFKLLLDYFLKTKDEKSEWSKYIQYFYNTALSKNRPEIVSYLKTNYANDLSDGEFLGFKSGASLLSYEPFKILDTTHILIVSDKPNIAQDNQLYLFKKNDKWRFMIKDSQGYIDEGELFYKPKQNYFIPSMQLVEKAFQGKTYQDLIINEDYQKIILQSIKAYEDRYWKNLTIDEVFFPLGSAVLGGNNELVKQCLDNFQNKKTYNGQSGALYNTLNGFPTQFYSNHHLDTYADACLYFSLVNHNFSIFQEIDNHFGSEKFQKNNQYKINYQQFLDLSVEYMSLDIIFYLLKKDPGLTLTQNQQLFIFKEIFSNIPVNMDYVDLLVTRFKKDVFIDMMEKSSGLHWAVTNNNPKLCDYLIKQGININKLDNDKLTPLHLAVNYRNTEIIQLLLDNNADINIATDNAYNALILSAQIGDLNAVKQILDVNKNLLNTPDLNDNTTALQIATAFGKKEAALFLLKEGADPLIPRGKNGACALHLAAEMGDEELLEAMLNHCKVQSNKLSNDGLHALHFAAQKGQLSSIKSLLKNQWVEKNPKDTNGLTMMHYAVGYGHKEIVNYLINNNNISTKEFDDNGKTALYYAPPSIETMLLTPIIQHEAIKFLSDLANPKTREELLNFTHLINTIQRDGIITIWNKIKDDVENIIFNKYGCNPKQDMNDLVKNITLENLNQFQKDIQQSEGYQQYCKEALINKTNNLLDIDPRVIQVRNNQDSLQFLQNLYKTTQDQTTQNQTTGGGSTHKKGF